LTCAGEVDAVFEQALESVSGFDRLGNPTERWRRKREIP